jgi:cytochrome c biogenesis protein CcmG/thiol:disulfide interchange protein DsbE
VRLATACALAVVVAASAAAADAPPPDRAPVGLSAVDPATGEKVALDWAQGPTHVAFIATWCRPCLEEAARLFDLQDRWKADGYRLFVVALPTRQSVERLKEFLGQGPVPGRLLFDADGSVSKAFAVTTIPAHILVDRTGRTVARAGALDEAFTQAVERGVRQAGRSQP